MYPFEHFNSWITRRVTSRRYPEATVVETYRLSEWAYFMELSGQLPDGMLDDVNINQEDTVYSNIKAAERVKEITLTDEQINQLRCCCSYITYFRGQAFFMNKFVLERHFTVVDKPINGVYPQEI